MTEPRGWTPSESLHEGSRERKARKISAILESHVTLEGARILDIGCGAGVIARWFSRRAGEEGEVWGVDVSDLRTVDEGFSFRLVSGTALPFEDDYFDVVISNHVIEHVGGPDQQLRHLVEISRLLKPGGCGYLATPQRWSIVEPHFRLPFLSWLPGGLRSTYVRAARKGTVYDCRLLTRPEVSRLTRQAGLSLSEETARAVQVVAEVEHSRVAEIVGSLPEGVLRRLSLLAPTLVYLLRPIAEGAR